jgi:RNA polymerase sigma factor (sigma-70 family)
MHGPEYTDGKLGPTAACKRIRRGGVLIGIDHPDPGAYVVLNVAEPPADSPRPAGRFDLLFRRNYAALYGLAYRLLGDRAEAEDTLQETFVRLARADAVLQRPDAEVAAWLRRVCLNLGTNRLRDERRARARLERAGRLDLASPTGDAGAPSSLLLRAEERAGVRRALARLPDRQRDCLLLRHSGYSYAEIADTLGIALGSVGVLLGRAEQAFRERYQVEEDPRT